jgi:hypothetical protein
MEKAHQFANDFGVQAQADLQEAANRMEDRMVNSLQQKLHLLADRVQASRATLEALLARFEALQTNAGILLEATEKRIAGASHLAVESGPQEITANPRAEEASATLEAEYQERIAATFEHLFDFRKPEPVGRHLKSPHK